MTTSRKKFGSLMYWLLLISCYLFASQASALTCASGWVTLTGSYYNNENASGTVAATRSDTNINFNWVAAGPGIGGLGADGWSVRWDGTVRAIKTGTYRFRSVTDDGVRLYVDGVQVIDDWNSHAATANTTTDLNFVAGKTYTIRMDYFDDQFDASAVLYWLQPGATEYALIPSVIGSPDTSSTCTCSDALVGGAVGAYYNNNNLTGSSTNSRLDTLLDFNWGASAPGPTGVGSDNFSVRWTGDFRPSTTGTYTFQTTSDDGVRLTVNGSALITSWQANNNVTYTSAGVAMTAGVSYPVILDFYDGTSNAIIKLQWKLGAGSYSSMGSCPASSVDHYGITLTSPGITCAGSAITISAYDSGGTLVAPANGTIITLSTSTGTGSWVGGNTATFNGTATAVTKYLQHTTAVTNLNINVTDGIASESGSIDPNITFSDSTLAFYGSTGLGAMPNQVAGTADTAPILKAGNCTTQVSGAKNVSFGYECRNPTSCVLGQTLSVNSNNIQSNADGASITYSAAQSLTFDGSGIASIPIAYSDVGKVKIHATMTLAASGNDPAITLTANSGDFIVKPHTLVATAIQTAAAVANPGGSSTSGAASGFVSAGTAFTTKVEVRNSAGNRTPNFGNETLSENNLTFVPQALIYPAGGTLTALTNASAFSATTPVGTFINTTINWDQVGSFTARPELADNDYLGAGDVIAKTTSGTIGRFYPDHFALVAGSTTTNSCGTFSYFSQPEIGLSYSLQAQGASNTVLTNYGGNYAAAAQAAPSYVAENANSGNGATFSSRLFDGTTPAWASGVMTVASTAAYVARVLTTYAPDGPYTSLQWGLDLIDIFDDGRSLSGKDMNAVTTGACGGGCTAVAIGSPLSMRYGRLRLDSASGPETADLPVNFVTEYWNGGSYVLNSLDSCTLLPRSIITYTPVAPVAGIGGTLASDANRTVDMAIPRTTTGIYQNLDVSGVHFSLGKAGHYFTAPTIGGVGSFTEGINLTTMPWLRYDWNQNGDFSDTALPNTTFTFGTYRGNDRIIYWHERLE